MTETVWPPKPEIFIIWSLTEKKKLLIPGLSQRFLNFNVKKNYLKDLLKPRLLCLPPEFPIQTVWIKPKNLHFHFFLMILRLPYVGKYLFCVP